MGLFLQPLPSVGAPMIVNGRTGHSVASSVEVATSRNARRKGLLGRDALPAGCAFLLAPCRAVHTIGMRFPIDVVFVDADGAVLKIVEHMSGWRFAIAASAAVTIELWAGAAAAMDVRVGDRLAVVPAFAQRVGRYMPSAITPDNIPANSLGVRPEVKRARPESSAAPVPGPREHDEESAGTLVA